MRHAITTAVVAFCAFQIGCENREAEVALNYIEYQISPGKPISGTAEDPFDVPYRPPLREQLINYGLTFDEPGSKLLTMRLNFSGFALLHTDEAHAIVQAFLTENNIDWSIREPDTEIERP
ncbi:MAG: hypothetical protein MI807_08695 [Verrucomicrobiales bacterium]|nr:hypothetical protein [Verrucomicrobiales bacterium]